MLAAAVSFQDLGDRGLEIVVDGAAWHAAPELEGMALPQEEGVLPLGGEHLEEHRSREAQPPNQKRHGAHLAPHLDRRFSKVELRPLPGPELQGHIGWSSLLLRPLPLTAHQLAHGRLARGDAHAPQLEPHPLGGPLLLGLPALQPLVLLEPTANGGQGRRAHRCVGSLLPLVAPLGALSGLGEELGHSVARHVELARRLALGMAFDQHKYPNCISSCHGIHTCLPSARLKSAVCAPA